MITATVQLPERLRYLPVFLAFWLLSYLGPHLLAAVADGFLRIGLIGRSPTPLLDVRQWVVWVGLLPVAYAWAQGLFMRRCLSTAFPWALAVFVGTFLGRFGQAVIAEADPRLLFENRPFQFLFIALAGVIGTNWASTVVMALPAGLCFGVATSVPQALVVPASTRWRALWIAVIVPTEVVSTALADGLYCSFAFGMLGSFSVEILWIRWIQLLTLNFVPRIAAWLLIATVSGLLMYVICGAHPAGWATPSTRASTSQRPEHPPDLVAFPASGRLFLPKSALSGPKRTESGKAHLLVK